MKVVAAFRRMVPVQSHHIALAARGFDWIEVLRMLARSARERAGCETFALTDQSDLGVPCHIYHTVEPELMLWILEVSLRYLESDDFDQDTVFVGVDTLILKPLDLFGGFDIALTSRKALDKYKSHPLMNGLQWWPLASKSKLVEFFTQALQIAKTLPAEEQRWGADTIPLIRLLGPIEAGKHKRGGMVVRFFPWPTLFEVNGVAIRKIRRGHRVDKNAVVADFKYRNKWHLKEYFERTFA